MANYEKIVVIPASLEDEFQKFLQKGNGLSKLKQNNVIKEETKVIKSILKKPKVTENKSAVKSVGKEKKSTVQKPTKKILKWRKL